MRTSRKTDFRKLKITLVTMTYHSQRPQCPSLSPHVLLHHYMWFSLQVFLQLETQSEQRRKSSKTVPHVFYDSAKVYKHDGSKNNLRTRNNDPRPKFTGSYIKGVYYDIFCTCYALRQSY